MDGFYLSNIYIHSLMRTENNQNLHSKIIFNTARWKVNYTKAYYTQYLGLFDLLSDYSLNYFQYPFRVKI